MPRARDLHRTGLIDPQQGAVYETIIKGVVDKSRNSFEEFGVSVSSLEELESVS